MANGETQEAADRLAITVAAISTVGLLGFAHCPGMCPGANWLLLLAVLGGVAHLLAKYMSSRGDATLPWSRVSHWACLTAVVSFLIGGTLGIAAASRNMMCPFEDHSAMSSRKADTPRAEPAKGRKKKK